MSLESQGLSKPARLLNRGEAAKWLGCSANHLRKLPIPTVCIGRLVKYRVADLIAFVDHQIALHDEAMADPTEEIDTTAGGRVPAIPVVWPIRREQRECATGKIVEMAVIRCPYCRAVHHHGWGSGRRIAHCIPDRLREAGSKGGQYHLECPESLPVSKRRP